MSFLTDRPEIERAYTAENGRRFRPETGTDRETLCAWAMETDERRRYDTDAQIVRGELFAGLLDRARVGHNPACLFADGFDCEGILVKILWHRQETLADPELRRMEAENAPAIRTHLFTVNPDYGHLCPDWEAIFRLGIPGILRRLEEAKRAHAALTPKQEAFYRGTEAVWSAIRRGVPRLAAVCPERTAKLLLPLAERPPKTFGEGLQLYVLLFRLFEYVDGQRTRSLGGVDRILEPLWKADLAAGRSEESLTEELRYFLTQLWSMHVPFDLPLFLAGQYADGTDAGSDFTVKFIETYASLDIYSPKIHVRVHEGTSDEILRAVCRSIRKGNSSFVFICDETAQKALKNAGLSDEDARNYVPIGCYEPCGYGTEVGCTGNGKLTLPRALELAMYDGLDPATGIQFGPHTGRAEEFRDFEHFYGAFLKQVKTLAERMMNTVRRYESHYAEVYPIPLFSATFAESVRRGADAQCGGAKYNNSSIYVQGIGSVTDSLVVLRRVYGGLLPVGELMDALRKNWQGCERLRQELDTLPRYGNNEPEADELAARLCKDIADFTLGQPNGRGGVFKPANFSIDHFIPAGKFTSATPDGRLAGTPLSKNTGALTGKDRAGLTALIQSAAKLHCELYPTGSVLDVMVHPSAVSGEDGPQILTSLVRTFFRLGGYAMHGNVVSPATLRAAQTDPETWRNLQVRLCGWNVYFVNLTREEQDDLIRAAESAEAAGF